MTNSDNACRDNIIINGDLIIHAVDDNDGYNWLGFWLTHTNDVGRLLEFNLNKKAFNIVKFYEWMAVNTDTPFQVKIKVLYSCLFSSLIYSCESWGDISNMQNRLLEIGNTKHFDIYRNKSPYYYICYKG